MAVSRVIDTVKLHDQAVGDVICARRVRPNEVSHIIGAFRHREANGGLGGDFFSVFGPIDEFIAVVGYRRERAFGTLFVDASPAHRATHFRIGFGNDGVIWEEIGVVE